VLPNEHRHKPGLPHGPSRFGQCGKTIDDATDSRTLNRPGRSIGAHHWSIKEPELSIVT